MIFGQVQFPVLTKASAWFFNRPLESKSRSTEALKFAINFTIQQTLGVEDYCLSEVDQCTLLRKKANQRHKIVEDTKLPN